MPVTIDQVRRASGVLNLAKLANGAGINRQTLYAKMRRDTPLEEEEAENIEAVLRQHGIELQ